VRHLAGGNELLQQRWVHAVDSEDDELVLARGGPG
jgi:hypothetical protein